MVPKWVINELKSVSRLENFPQTCPMILSSVFLPICIQNLALKGPDNNIWLSCRITTIQFHYLLQETASIFYRLRNVHCISIKLLYKRLARWQKGLNCHKAFTTSYFVEAVNGQKLWYWLLRAPSISSHTQPHESIENMPLADPAKPQTGREGRPKNVILQE